MQALRGRRQSSRPTFALRRPRTPRRRRRGRTLSAHVSAPSAATARTGSALPSTRAAAHRSPQRATGSGPRTQQHATRGCSRLPTRSLLNLRTRDLARRPSSATIIMSRLASLICRLALLRFPTTWRRPTQARSSRSTRKPRTTALVPCARPRSGTRPPRCESVVFWCAERRSDN
eukprot:Amastigsp_a687994_16.p2 type:complete len:175 gc:universal Amastigsp_a687994_16:893-1417(+)